MDIELTQRGGPAVVRRRDYEDHWSTGLAILVANRIVRLEHRADFVLVYPNQYVGSARCAGRRLVIQARYSELLLQLRKNFPLNRRDVPLEGFDPAEERKVLSDFTIHFLHGLSEVVNHGLPFRYIKHSFAGPSLYGHLNVGKTIRRFTSRNIQHEAVTERFKKTFDSDLIDIVWCATASLHETGALSPDEEAHLDVLLTAAGPASQVLSHTAAISAAEALTIMHTDRPDVVELLKCCQEVLSHNRTEHDIEAPSGDVSFSFTDADALWERAVHQAMRQAGSRYGWHARLHPLRSSSTRMFDDGGPQIDPDVIVYKDDASVLMPVDAKDFAQRSSEASGVYQATAYARTLRTSATTLVYLAAESDWLEEFGDTSVTVYAIGIRPTGADVLVRLAAACGEVAELVADPSPTSPAA